MWTLLIAYALAGLLGLIPDASTIATLVGVLLIGWGWRARRLEHLLLGAAWLACGLGLATDQGVPQRGRTRVPARLTPASAPLPPRPMPPPGPRPGDSGAGAGAR